MSGLLYSFLIILDGLKIPPATIKSKTLDSEIPDTAQYNSTKDNKTNSKMRNNNNNENIDENKSTDSRMLIRRVAETKSTNPFATDGDGDGDMDMTPDKNVQQDDRIIRDEKKRKKNNGYMPLTFPSQECSREISGAYDAGREMLFASPKSSSAVSSNPFDSSDDDSEKDVEKEVEVGVEAEVKIGAECVVGGENDKVADQGGLITRTSPTVPVKVKDNCEMENKCELECDTKAVGQLEKRNDHLQIVSNRTITTTPPPSHHSQIPHTDPQSCVPVGLRNSQTQIQDSISEQKPYTTTAIKVRNPLVEKILPRHHPFSPQYYEFIGPKFFFFFISCFCVTLFWVLQFPQLFHFSSRGREIEYDEKCVKTLSLIFGMLIAICTGTWLSLIVKVSK